GKDLGPGEAALLNQGIQKGGSVQDLARGGKLEIGFEVRLRTGEIVDLVLRAGDVGAKIVASAPGAIGLHRENQKQDKGKAAGKAIADEEAPVIFERGGRQIETKFHDEVTPPGSWTSRRGLQGPSRE